MAYLVYVYGADIAGYVLVILLALLTTWALRLKVALLYRSPWGSTKILVVFSFGTHIACSYCTIVHALRTVHGASGT